jgi:DNA repair exonuclease SbcCD ATPase subunit
MAGRRWEEGENAMQEIKKNPSWQNDTGKLKRRDQVAVTRLRTGYSRGTHRNKMGGAPDPDCPFCSAKLTQEHILWQCKETDEERRKSNMTKEVWEKGEEQAKMLVEYVKNIGLYYGL